MRSLTHGSTWTCVRVRNQKETTVLVARNEAHARDGAPRKDTKSLGTVLFLMRVPLVLYVVLQKGISVVYHLSSAALIRLNGDQRTVLYVALYGKLEQRICIEVVFSTFHQQGVQNSRSSNSGVLQKKTFEGKPHFTVYRKEVRHCCSVEFSVELCARNLLISC